MTLHYDIAIIGGGIAGCAIAYQFKTICPQARLILIEQSTIAGKTTGESGGFIWPQHSHAAKQSYLHYQQLGQQNDIDFTELQLTLTTNNQQQLLAAARIQPSKCCQAWLDFAQSRGADIIIQQSIQSFQHRLDERNFYLQGKELEISANCVVLATGSQLDLIPSQATAKLEQYCFQSTRFSLPESSMDAHLNITQDYYILPIPNQQLVAGFLSRDQQVIQQIPSIDPNQIEEINRHVDLYFPRAKMLKTQQHLDSFTPNQYPLFKADPIEKNLYYALGMSSGGIKYAPFLAKKLAENICKTL